MVVQAPCTLGVITGSGTNPTTKHTIVVVLIWRCWLFWKLISKMAMANQLTWWRKCVTWKTNKQNMQLNVDMDGYLKTNCGIRKNAGSTKWSRRNDTCKSRESQQVCVSASRENRSLWSFCLRKSSLRELNYTLVRKCRIWTTTAMLMDPFSGGQWEAVGC